MVIAVSMVSGVLFVVVVIAIVCKPCGSRKVTPVGKQSQPNGVIQVVSTHEQDPLNIVEVSYKVKPELLKVCWPVDRSTCQ